MDEITISLASIPVGIRPRTQEVRSFFRDYLCDAPPRFSVEASAEDLEYEKILYHRRNGEDLSSPLSDAVLERTALLRLIANRIPEYDTVLFHGSVVAVDGKAYLFAARSGTGKTTHTRLWLRQLPQAYVLNGDKPFLKLDGSGRVLACGTPWRGKEAIGCNEILPLKAICYLERAAENRIVPMTPRDAAGLLMPQLYLPEGLAGVRAIQVLDRISRNVRLFRLGCNMEADAARVSTDAMLGSGSA